RSYLTDLSSIDDTTDSDIPNTPPSPTHCMPFTEITSSTQRSPIIPQGSSDFHSDASSNSSSRHSLSDHSSPDLLSTSARPSRKRHVKVDPRETSLRDDVIVRGSDEPHLDQDIDPDIHAEIDECIDYVDALRNKGIDARVVVEHVDREESKTGTRGPVEVRVERVTNPAMPEDTCAKKNKLEAYFRNVRSSLQNKKSVVNTKDIATMQNSMLNLNSDLQCVTCNGCLFFDNHDSCVLEFINIVNARVKSKSVKKPLKRKVWKPTGKVFKNIGYKWRPTGRTFTIVGNACPLTRITTIAKVPLRKPIALESNTPKPVVFQIVLWYLDSGCSKHMTGDRSQLTNFVNKFLGTVKFSNDHVAKIIGYGDYHIGNVTISRVYFIEVLGHNLFSIGQFCDSDLEVAFRQHTCFIRNLEGVDLLIGS
nr:integrase, catalytic region, zinc finger, CCHC-type, peptidase aspartic, catalytic [Tanacetum cinerariifolium]